MSSTSLPRVMGFVAVPVRKEPGIVAHRVERIYDSQRTAGQLTWQKDKGDVLIVPACLPKGQMPDVEHHELSSAMANHIGAVACTKAACFPDAATPPAEDPMPAQSGPAITDEVWIAARRKAIEAHRIAGDPRLNADAMTVCGRSMRTGLTVLAGEASGQHQARWCRRCWPSSA